MVPVKRSSTATFARAPTFENPLEAVSEAIDRMTFDPAVDGSRESKRAAQAAVQVAARLNAEISIAYVLPPSGRKLVSRARLHQIEALEEQMQSATISPRLRVLFGRPAETIVAQARKENADLIVVGSRGLTGLRTVVPGGVSHRVAHAAHCSVLLVKTET